MRASLKTRRRPAAGFSFIEVIVFIVIVGAALAGVLSVLNVTAFRSADPMQIKQAVAIGESFIDEILSRDYSNSIGVHTDPRSQFLGVDDYDTYSSIGIKTRANVAVAGLAQYSVAISVAAPAAISGVPLKKITVTVTDPSSHTYPFTAYKAGY